MIVNYTIQDTLLLNIFIGFLFALLHTLYMRHALIGLQPNRNRCRHLLRVSSTVLVVISILVANILYKEGVLTSTAWHEYILIVEGLVLFMIWIDATFTTFGFHSDDIYGPVPNTESNVNAFGV